MKVEVGHEIGMHFLLYRICNLDFKPFFVSISRQIWRLLLIIHNIALKQRTGTKIHLFIIFYNNIYYKIFKGE